MLTWRSFGLQPQILLPPFFLFVGESVFNLFYYSRHQFSTDESASMKQVKNPLEESEVVGITNYIDFGFELQTRYFNKGNYHVISLVLVNFRLRKYFWRMDDAKTSNNISDSTFQVAASWQANKNFLLKVIFIMQTCLLYSKIVNLIDIVLFLFAGKDGTSQLITSSGGEVLVETCFYFQHFRYALTIIFMLNPIYMWPYVVIW